MKDSVAITTDTTDATRAAIGMASHYATVWADDSDNARPVATLSRPRIMGETPALFRLVRTDGQTLKTWTRAPSLAHIRVTLDNMRDTGAEVRAEARGITPAEVREMALFERSESADLEGRAMGLRPAGGNNPGTLGRVAILLNRAARHAVRAGHLEALAVDLERDSDCGPCGGSGWGAGSDGSACPECDGTGKAPQTAPEAPAEGSGGNHAPEAQTAPQTAPEAPAEPLNHAPAYDMAQHDLAPVQSGGFPLWAFDAAPVDHMREFDLDSAWADLNPLGGL